MATDREFCRRLIALRVARNMTQAQLADAAGMHNTMVCHYERGDRAPGLGAIKALCFGLRCTATELIGV